LLKTTARARFSELLLRRNIGVGSQPERPYFNLRWTAFQILRTLV
jgi:hypothetical protein